jgi:hypothetical protein
VISALLSLTVWQKAAFELPCFKFLPQVFSGLGVKKGDGRYPRPGQLVAFRVRGGCWGTGERIREFFCWEHGRFFEILKSEPSETDATKWRAVLGNHRLEKDGIVTVGVTGPIIPASDQFVCDWVWHIIKFRRGPVLPPAFRCPKCPEVMEIDAVTSFWCDCCDPGRKNPLPAHRHACCPSCDFDYCTKCKPLDGVA